MAADTTFGWTLPEHALPRFADVDGDGVLDLVAVLPDSVAMWTAPGRDPGDADVTWTGVAAAVALTEGTVAVGVPTASAIYLLAPSISGSLADLASARLEGPEETGAALDWLPDVDGDGTVELVGGAPGASVGGEQAGEVGLWFGPQVSGPADWVVDNDKGARFGSSVVVLDSVIAAGGPAADDDGLEAGAVLFFDPAWK